MRLRSWAIGIAAALGLVGAALAQSGPGWVASYVPPPSEWQTWWTKKLDVANGAASGLTSNSGTYTNTVRLNFGSGTAASTTDYSKHIDLSGGNYGINITGGRLNIGTSVGSSCVDVVIGTTDVTTTCLAGFSVNQPLSLNAGAQFNKEVSFPSGGFTLSGSHIGTGLSIGWNGTGGQGEADLLLGSAGAPGGLRMYATSASGIVNTTPVFNLSGTGDLAIPATLQATGGMNSTPVGAATPSTGSFTTLGSTGVATLADAKINGTDNVATAWACTTPTPTADSGTFGSASSNICSKKVGRIVFIHVLVTITTVGSATGNVSFPLPYATSANSYVMIAGRNETTGSMIVGTQSTGSTAIIVSYNSVGQIAASTILFLNGTYESAS